MRSGKYYAAIVIPDNFSESLLSILSGDIKQPKLDYYINEKKNAIAPKITDTGASTIQQEINDTFTSVAAESISELLSKEAGELSGKVSEENSSLIKAIADTRRIWTNIIRYWKTSRRQWISQMRSWRVR